MAKTYPERQAHTLIYTILYGYLTAKLFECNIGKHFNGGNFTINSSLQSLKELVKGTHENTISCTIEVHIITTLLDKLLVFSNFTASKLLHFGYSIWRWLWFAYNSEHTGDWQLHLNMSAWCCHTLQCQVTTITIVSVLQTMSQIHVTHPDLH